MRPHGAGPDGGLLASGVTVRFGDVTALDGAALEAPPGTVTGLVGPNGAGKTTLFDVLSGLRRPDRGTVHLGGADVTAFAPGRRARHGLARALPQPGGCGSLTVREHVRAAAEERAMTREIHGRSARDRWRRRRAARRAAGQAADALLSRVGIAAHAGRLAATLPAGTARLAELARALAAEPRVLLLDGPSAGLSVPEARSLEVLVRDLAAEGLAVLLAEPCLDAAMGVCDVLYVLDRGTVIASGPPVEVRSDPRVQDACPPRHAQPAGQN